MQPTEPRKRKKPRPTQRQTPTKREHSFVSKIGVGIKPAYYHSLFFGPSRAGKTTLLGSAGQYEPTSPTLILDFEGGSNSVIGLPGVSVARMHSWDDFTEAYDYLLRSDHPFKSVSVDSVSELHVFTVLDIIEREVSTAKHPRSEDTGEISDYGKAMVMLRRFLRHMFKLKMHVFVTALNKEITVPKEGRMQVPFMFGQLAGEIVGNFPVATYLVNEVTNLGKGQSSKMRNLYLHSQEGIRAGVRVPMRAQLPEVLHNPTIAKLFEAVDAAYAQEEQ